MNQNPPASERINKITEKIIGCAYSVINSLGNGFFEKVYENALAHEIHKNGIKVIQQSPMKVMYDGIVVGEYYADLLVEDCVLVELKTVPKIDQTHIAQCLHYLKATGLTVCLLLNFSHPKLEKKRIVYQFPDPINLEQE
jgi:GxxExxY protein